MGQSELNLSAGTVISFATMNELHTFETGIGPLVAPNMMPIAEQIWLSRVPLRELFQIPKFNGRLTDIKLQVLADPLTVLHTLQDEGTKFVQGYRANVRDRTPTHIKKAQQTSLGFVLSAEAHSTGRGVIGTIEAGLWYIPTYDHYASGVSDTSSRCRDPGVKRIITKPVKDDERFQALHATASRIGHDLLQKSIVRPLRSPMQN